MKSYSPAIAVSVYENVFEPSNFVEKLEQFIYDTQGEDVLSWNSSSTGIGKIGQYRTSLLCPMQPLLPPIPETPLSKIFRDEIYAPLSAVTLDYIVDSGAAAGTAEPLQLLKYEGYAEYRAHHDHSPDSRRIWSVVACMGKAEEGGELEFPNFDVTISLDAGSVIMFPSNFPYLHIAHPVKKGTKYSLVTWYS